MPRTRAEAPFLLNPSIWSESRAKKNLEGEERERGNWRISLSISLTLDIFYDYSYNFYGGSNDQNNLINGGINKPTNQQKFFFQSLDYIER